MIRLFRVFFPVGALALLLSEVLLIASSFLVITTLILNVDPAVFLFHDRGLLRAAVAAASILFGLFWEDLYARIYVTSRVLLLQQLCLVMGIALLLQGFIGYVNEGFRLPLRIMLPAAALLIAALFAWRLAYSALVLRVVGAQRILFVGLNPLLAEMAAHIEAHPELGMQVVGHVGDDPAAAAPPGAGKLLGPLADLQEIAAAVRPDRIVVGFTDRRRRMPVAALLQLRYNGFAIEEAPAAYEQLCGRVPLGELHPAQLVLSAAFRPRPERLVYQALGNWLLALLLAVLSAPLLLLALVLLRFSSGGPLLSRKPCVGLGGKPFTRYALRVAGSGGVPKFVRRWRLDALPALWNVLRGEMCFVGPRADRPEYLHAMTELIPFYRQRCSVKPGLTGWAQINIPTDRPEDTLRRLEYDFYYVKNFSRALDTYILLHALKGLAGAPAA
jgi:lipopolysaccharide/colanic/teichoic acid biosynthesis glycosyltransferase